MDSPQSAIGQCAVTALVLNDYCSGHIRKCMVGDISHYFNIIDNKVVDFTASQFDNQEIDYNNSKSVSRAHLLTGKEFTKRYEILKDSVKEEFSKTS